jgi:hypothetical protein
VIQTCVSKRAIQSVERVSEQDIIAKIQVQEQKQDIGLAVLGKQGKQKCHKQM